MQVEKSEENKINQDEYKSLLRSIGLNENEAQVYSLLLNNGQMNIYDINKSLPEINRTNLYNVLYSLRDSGVVEQTFKNKKINFKPANPYQLRDILRQRKLKIIESEAIVEGILPRMLSLYNLTTDKPSVRHYEGIDGLKLVYQELNQSGAKELLLIRSVYDDEHKELTKLIENQIANQTKLKISTRALTPLVPDSSTTFQRRDADRLVTRRIVDRSKLILPAQILIWKKSVAISSMKGKLISTVIENKSIADTFKTIFEYIWDSSAQYHRKVIKSWEAGQVGQDRLQD